ncbi:hypothetical protein AVEN_53216-1 [Araneus ventricosus]|uniref:Uncharacterized protein n=1 Tax=Araneus ventricosus TaxID=182803 RepID=A0A4Y2ABX5_ARAVE|nr:hypothetical protein AVEN_53216-1 [Araneus ventricosus]
MCFAESVNRINAEQCSRYSPQYHTRGSASSTFEYSFYGLGNRFANADFQRDLCSRNLPFRSLYRLTKAFRTLQCYVIPIRLGAAHPLQVCRTGSESPCILDSTAFGNGPPAQKVENCIQNILKPEEIKSVFQFVEDNYYKYKSDNIPGAVKEYCNDDDDTRHDAYDKTLNGVLAYEKKVCADGDKAGECSRVGQTIVRVALFKNSVNKEKQCVHKMVNYCIFLKG